MLCSAPCKVNTAHRHHNIQFEALLEITLTSLQSFRNHRDTHTQTQKNKIALLFPAKYHKVPIISVNIPTDYRYLVKRKPSYSQFIFAIMAFFYAKLLQSCKANHHGRRRGKDRDHLIDSFQKDAKTGDIIIRQNVKFKMLKLPVHTAPVSDINHMNNHLIIQNRHNRPVLSNAYGIKWRVI